MADRVAAAGIMSVRKIESAGFEGGLDFAEIFAGADFAKSDDIRLVAGEDLGDGLLFRVWLGCAFERLAVHVAIHRKPVLDVVGDETQAAG